MIIDAETLLWLALSALVLAVAGCLMHTEEKRVGTQRSE